MAETIWFRPKAGLKIPVDPVHEPGVYFPPDGARAVLNSYIRRRISDGTGEVIDPFAAETVTEQMPEQETAPPEKPGPEAIAKMVAAAGHRFRGSRAKAEPATVTTPAAEES